MKNPYTTGNAKDYETNAVLTIIRGCRLLTEGSSQIENSNLRITNSANLKRVKLSRVINYDS